MSNVIAKMGRRRQSRLAVKPTGRRTGIAPAVKGQPMWIFTRHGFFSVVCARQGDDRADRHVDPERMMVRARVRQHLEALKERFPDLLGESEIHDSAGTDYAYRFFTPKVNWTQVLAGLSDETDYDNFKSAVARHQGTAGADYTHSLHDVWSVMHGLQGRKRR